MKWRSGAQKNFPQKPRHLQSLDHRQDQEIWGHVPFMNTPSELVTLPSPPQKNSCKHVQKGISAQPKGLKNPTSNRMLLWLNIPLIFRGERDMMKGWCFLSLRGMEGVESDDLSFPSFVHCCCCVCMCDWLTLSPCVCVKNKRNLGMRGSHTFIRPPPPPPRPLPPLPPRPLNNRYRDEKQKPFKVLKEPTGQEYRRCETLLRDLQVPW